MANMVTLEAPENNKVYFATLIYARAWLNFDCSLLAMVNGKLTGELIGWIGEEYGVAPRLPLGQRDRLATLINKSMQEWPNDLLGRAAFCTALTAKALDLNLTLRHQSSAITKLIWFLRPAGWTMFDKLAADGMGIGFPSNRPARMIAFYNALSRLGFTEADLTLQQVIAKSGWPDLPAGRILDIMLMRRSDIRASGPNMPAAAMAFLMALPEESRKSLHKLACDAQDALTDDILPPLDGN